MIKNKSTLMIIAFLISSLVTVYVSNKVVNYVRAEAENKTHLFLIFPSDKSYVYKTKSFNSNEKLGKIDRAVTVSYPEIQSGIAEVILDEKECGYAAISTFNYLPPTEYDKYIINWKKYLKFQGYTDGQYEIKPARAKRYIVTFIMKDSKHARSHKYMYETDGKTICNIGPVGVFSGFNIIFYAIIFIPVYLLTMIVMKYIVALNKSAK